MSSFQSVAFCIPEEGLSRGLMKQRSISVAYIESILSYHQSIVRLDRLSYEEMNSRRKGKPMTNLFDFGT